MPNQRNDSGDDLKNLAPDHIKFRDAASEPKDPQSIIDELRRDLNAKTSDSYAGGARRMIDVTGGIFGDSIYVSDSETGENILVKSLTLNVEAGGVLNGEIEILLCENGKLISDPKNPTEVLTVKEKVFVNKIHLER